jgi:hypothetical protein
MGLDEQETTVTYVRSDDKVHIYTANPKHLRRLRMDERATVTRDFGDSAEFTVPAAWFDPLTGFKTRRKPLTAEQRQAATERLALARSKQGR